MAEDKCLISFVSSTLSAVMGIKTTDDETDAHSKVIETFDDFRAADY
jgi:hypothetical protein